MRPRSSVMSWAAALSISVAGCEPQASESDYAVTVLVEGDAAVPVASALIQRGAVSLGTTNPDGKVTVRLRGSEGEMVSVRVVCPSNHTSPTEPLNLLLRRLEDSAQPLYRARCAPEIRTVVVAVRAVNGPELPVLYLGKEVARTDSAGAAHFQLRLRPGERFQLTFSTTAFPSLRPVNPSAAFAVKERDEVIVFEQTFESTSPKRATRSGPKAF